MRWATWLGYMFCGGVGLLMVGGGQGELFGVTPRSISMDLSSREFQPSSRDFSEFSYLPSVSNVPREVGKSEENQVTLATNMLRVCVSEASFSSWPDCVGIWEVAKNVRSRKCDRQKLPSITTCSTRGETVASALRRLSPRVTGGKPARTTRQRWVSHLDLSCEMPEGYPSRQRWNGVRDRCLHFAQLVRGLARGQAVQRVTLGRGVAIAWGGRCERPGGACDDAMACRRGLARIPTETANAFWCRPGSRGCRDDIEPLCFRNGWLPAGWHP